MQNTSNVLIYNDIKRYAGNGQLLKILCQIKKSGLWWPLYRYILVHLGAIFSND